MSNLLQAIKNIIEHQSKDVQNIQTGLNRAQNMGDGLEIYIKDTFAGTMDIDSETARMEILKDLFSFQGNKNHPPDLMIRGGDAIEIKKIESPNGSLALNSSFPKNKLYQNDSRISQECRICEDWDEKDILYIVGSLYSKTNKLRYLYFVYGDCYAANKSFYEKISNTITNGLKEIPDIDFVPTNELSGIKKVDPLGITNLRIRGMWHIENPYKVFDYLQKQDSNSQFNIFCLMKKEKYETFNTKDRASLKNIDNLKIADVKIKNPDNPVNLIDCKYLEYNAHE